jgi:hypothetical protein
LNSYQATGAATFQAGREPGVWQCFGFVSAVSQFAYLYLDGKNVLSVCLPSGVSTTQLIRVIVAYGHNHPEELHVSTGLFVLNALVTAFPCK